MRKQLLAIGLFFLNVMLSTTGYSQPGSNDSSFDPGSGANNTVRAIAIQTDGKTIIVGDFTSYNGTSRNRIARLNVDGSLDADFDPGTGADNIVRTIAIQTDGKIIIGGSFTTYNGIASSRLARLNADGSLDNTFAIGSGVNNAVFKSFIQLNGKIVIVGLFNSYNGTGRIRIARLNADGSLDNTFNPGLGPNNNMHTTFAQPDGKIIIGGNFTSYNGTGRNRIARLNADGTLDATFDPGTGVNSIIHTIFLQPDGKIIIGGNFTSYNGTVRNRIARLNEDGSLDATFTHSANNVVSEIAMQPDGRIIIVGSFTNFNGNIRHRIARVNADGSLDATISSGTNNAISGVALQPDGKIIIGGQFINFGGTARNRVARILGDIPHEWIGTNSIDWDMPGNWSTGSVPSSADDVTIPASPAGGNMPTVNVSTAQVASITIESGANLSITPGNALTVNGVLTNNGTVNVQNAASLVQSASSTLGTGSGNFNVSRNGSGVYDYWSTPTAGTPTSFLGDNVFQYNPVTGSMDNADDNTGSGDPGWVSASGLMTAGRGYAAYGAGSKIFTGIVHNGDVAAAVQYHTPESEPFSGTFVQGVPFNLIGNPYPSGINVVSFLSLNNAAVLEDGTIYLWDHPVTGSYATGDYAEMNAATFTSGGGSTASTYPVIGSHQGFTVRVKSGVTEVNFNNGMRTVGNTAAFFKQDDSKLLWLSVVSSGNHYNQTAIGFFDDATDAADWSYDAPKLNTSSALSLFSYMDGRPYGIQVYGPLGFSRIVPLGLHTIEPQLVTFRLDSTEQMPSEQIVLEDRKLGIFHDLRSSGYTCAVSGGLYDSRFFLHLSTELIAGVESQMRNPCMGAWMHDGILTVMMDDGASAGTPLELLDMQGRAVWRASQTSARIEADLSGLARGFYTFRTADAKIPCIVKMIR
jgi:uncharacterized delta-60 repeat protein